MRLLPFESFKLLWRQRHLVASLSWRDVLGRYRGSAGGLMWSLLTPLLMLTVYSLVFAGVFKARWGLANESPLDYALLLFVGLIFHSLLAECINRAPGLVVGNVSYVKRVVFPLEVLPVVSLLSALFHFLISLAVLLAFYGVVHGSLPAGALWLPLIVAPFVLLLAGLSWLLAGLGVYLRDISQLTGLLSTVLLFLSPVFYPAGSLPPELQTALQLNPLTLIIEQARAVIALGQRPDFAALGFYALLSAGITLAGYYSFVRMKRGFADVL